MNENHSSSDQEKVDRLLAELEKLRNKHISKELDSVTLPTKPTQEKKEIFHITPQASLPRMGSRFVIIYSLIWN